LWYLSGAMTRGPALVALRSLAALALLACDHSGPLADLDAGATWAIVPSAASATTASPSPAAPRDAGRVMPPRPVPTSSPTVRITMPMQVQMQAIEYMAAMQAPQPSDAPADAAYARSIATALGALGKAEVASGGRQIDVTMPKGCDATLPKEAIARRTSASLLTLLSHGVLVVRCTDREVQCLQSTRDADDVLCTHK
jgi:hypothetical protein